ncbi:MAG: histidine kinase [Lachnospiraceae bacterium]|nr:histidine kinase [Lachnospiraceae bacterium]
MTEFSVNALVTVAPLLLILIGLGITVAIDSYISRGQRRVLMGICVLTILLVLEDVADTFLATRIVNPPARTWNSILGYCVRPVILMLFLYVVGVKNKARVLWLLICVNALIHLTAVFDSKICFGFPGNNFYRGPLGYTAHVVSGILLGCLLFRTIREYSRVRRAEMWIPICNVLLIVTAVVLDSFILTSLEGPVSLTTIVIVCTTLFFYIWLHLQFVREHERDLMAAQRIRIMMTQIQPHFLYNTLSTIQSLCRTDPDKAVSVTEEFGTYLRQNLESLNRTDLIPIQKELEHTRVYTGIEEVRFPRIRIEYDIEDTEFSVPALTVQPLVENAIRHGVRICQNGLVTIATRKGNACHEIIITDNGKGFDVKNPELDGETHIGIRNVRERIETMCGGTLTIDSVVDVGTTIMIRIPEERMQRGKETVS